MRRELFVPCNHTGSYRKLYMIMKLYGRKSTLGKDQSNISSRTFQTYMYVILYDLLVHVALAGVPLLAVQL